MSLKTERYRKALAKKTRKGFQGYPVATVAFYGPDDRAATKVVAAFVAHEGAAADPIRKWFSDHDVRRDAEILEEILEFLRELEPRSIALTDGIIGCPHEEGIDYPEGEACPLCPFWHARDRWTGARSH